MSDLGYRSLDELAAAAGTDKGNLSRVFRQLQYPRVNALEPLAVALDVSVYELLIRIGAVDPARKDVPAVTRSTASLKWPRTTSRS